MLSTSQICVGRQLGLGGGRLEWRQVRSRGLLGNCLGLEISKMGALDNQGESPEGLVTPTPGEQL